ncbi:MAG: PAS domain S-box protein [Burkholderiaceae bacterium]
MLSPSLIDPRELARDLATRRTLMIFAAVFGVAALTNAWANRHQPWPLIVPAVAYAVGAALCAAATRLRGRRADAALEAAGVAGVLLVALAAVVYGWGLNDLALGYCAIVTLAFAAFFSARAGVAMALLCIAVATALAWAEHEHWIAGAAAVGDTLLLRRLMTFTLLIATALAVGLLMVRLIAHWLETAREREGRFLTLMGIATDCCWEMDAEYVVTQVWRRDARGAFKPVPRPMQQPWHEASIEYDDGALAPHRADLEARRPFRELHVRYRYDDGRVRDELVSGAPRHARDGRFLGYWGVSRDVTAEYGARDSLRSAEDSAHEAQALLLQMLETSPNVLSLSDADSGQFLMVSAMFEKTFGYTRDEVIGRRTAELGIWKDPHDRERMLAELALHGRIEDMSFEFRAKDGHTCVLSCSASISQSHGQRYLVMIGRDLSERERERRERDAILDNASIGIAMTRDRRFVMVNRRFETLFGWSAGALLGQAGAAVWLDQADYAEIGRLYGPALARGEQIEFERRMRRRDGSTFLGRVVGKAVDPQRAADGGTIWIVDDVTERREVERALAQARDAAEAASRAKSAFLANTSHEIRTPLNGLLGLARLARQRGVDEALRQNYLDQIADSAENLSAIISDILDLSKIEAGKLEIEASDFDLHALLQSLHRGYASVAAPRGIGVTLAIDPAVPVQVRGDAMRLRQILSNYLHNALKFTARGHVALQARALADGRLRFEVTDTGAGIDAATQARLFQPFTQADDSITRRFGGTGLGLSICRELARLMGGDVGVDSRVGRGSTFHVDLPLPAVAAQPPRPAEAASASSTLAGAHVLLVEDNPVNMLVARTMLEQWGLRIEAAADGQEALDAVAAAAQRGDAFDAVLMDVQMPGMSGYEATQRLREHHPAQELPVIALTAAALVSEREQALALGMNDFLTKPIDGEKLFAVLQRWIRRH